MASKIPCTVHIGWGISIFVGFVKNCPNNNSKTMSTADLGGHVEKARQIVKIGRIRCNK